MNDPIEIAKIEVLKWVATICLIVGFGGVAADIYPFIFLQLFGGILWLWAALIIKDRPLIVTNGMMTLAGIVGVISKYFG